MTQMTPREQFEEGVKAFVKELWVKRKNPMFPRNKAAYPARVTHFVEVTVDGRKKTFRVEIKPRIKWPSRTAIMKKIMRTKMFVLLASLLVAGQGFAAQDSNATAGVITNLTRIRSEMTVEGPWDGKCPLCKQEGKKSTILMNGTATSTLIATYERLDENGKSHYEDPNIHTSGGRCSNGHDICIRRCRGITKVTASLPDKKPKEEASDFNGVTNTVLFSKAAPPETIINSALISPNGDSKFAVTVDGIVRCKGIECEPLNKLLFWLKVWVSLTAVGVVFVGWRVLTLEATLIDVDEKKHPPVRKDTVE